jgi:hypothetical protein
MAEPYEKTHMLSPRKSTRTLILSAMAAALIGLGALGVWLSPSGSKGRELGFGIRPVEQGARGEVATSGNDNIAGTEHTPGTGVPFSLMTLDNRSLDSDAEQLIGRTVDIRVPVERATGVAFWAGSGDDQLLVVMGRDTRSGPVRQKGEPSTSNLQTPDGVQQVTLSGRIERVPHAEGLFSWRLTNHDRARLAERPIYLRVTRMSIE